MPIVVNLDVMMAKRKMSLSQLSEKVDITLANLSILGNFIGMLTDSRSLLSWPTCPS